MTLRTLKRLIFLFWLSVCLISAGCGGTDKRKVVYIRESYYGWVRIEYGVKVAAKLPSERFLHGGSPSFSSAGLLQTSSELQQDEASVEFYYGTAREIRPVPADMIHGRITSLNVTRADGSPFEREFETAFIGPETEYEKHRQELDRFRRSNDKYVIPTVEDLPKVGNIRR